MNPPFSLGCAQRKRAVHGPKERRLGAKRHVVPFLLKTRGPTRDCAENFSRSVGRGHGFAEICRRTARDELLPCVGLQNRFDFLLPAAAALPTLNRLSRYRPVARSEAERAERVAGQIRQPPRKPLRTPKCGEAPSLVPKAQAHPVGDSQLTGAPSRPTPALVQTCPNGQDLDTKAPFFSTAAAATFLTARRKKSGGRIPRPGPVGRLPPSPPRGRAK